MITGAAGADRMDGCKKQPTARKTGAHWRPRRLHHLHPRCGLKRKEREVGERRGYGFAGLVIVLAIVFAAAAWNNKINLSRLNDQLTGIKNEIQKELNTDTTMETIGNGVVTPPAVTTEVPTQSPAEDPAQVPAANVSPAGIQ